MKKIIILSLVAFVVLMSSCKKYELSEEFSIDTLQKVTVSGVVQAPMETGKMVFVPQGTQIVFTISKAAYNLNSTATVQGNYVVTATVGANGEYSVSIPATTQGVQATVSSSNFIGIYKESDIVSYNKNYTFNTTTVNCNPNNNIVVNFTFAAQNIPTSNGEITPTKTVTLSGKLEYISALHTNSFVYDTLAIPQGTQIKAEITLSEINGLGSDYKIEKFITVGANGTYSIDVPMIVSGQASVKLSASINAQYTVYNAQNAIDTQKFYRYELNATTGIYEINRTNVNYLFNRTTQLN